MKLISALLVIISLCGCSLYTIDSSNFTNYLSIQKESSTFFHGTYLKSDPFSRYFPNNLLGKYCNIHKENCYEKQESLDIVRYEVVIDRPSNIEHKSGLSFNDLSLLVISDVAIKSGYPALIEDGYSLISYCSKSYNATSNGYTGGSTNISIKGKDNCSAKHIFSYLLLKDASYLKKGIFSLADNGIYKSTKLYPYKPIYYPDNINFVSPNDGLIKGTGNLNTLSSMAFNSYKKPLNPRKLRSLLLGRYNLDRVGDYQIKTIGSGSSESIYDQSIINY